MDTYDYNEEKEESKTEEYIKKDGVSKKKQTNSYKYAYRIYYWIRQGSKRQEKLEELAQGLGCGVDCNLIDRLLDGRLEIIAYHKRKMEEAAALERKAADLRLGRVKSEPLA